MLVNINIPFSVSWLATVVSNRERERERETKWLLLLPDGGKPQHGVNLLEQEELTIHNHISSMPYSHATIQNWFIVTLSVCQQGMAMGTPYLHVIRFTY